MAVSCRGEWLAWWLVPCDCRLPAELDPCFPLPQAAQADPGFQRYAAQMEEVVEKVEGLLGWRAGGGDEHGGGGGAVGSGGSE